MRGARKPPWATDDKCCGRLTHPHNPGLAPSKPSLDIHFNPHATNLSMPATVPQRHTQQQLHTWLLLIPTTTCHNHLDSHHGHTGYQYIVGHTLHTQNPTTAATLRQLAELLPHTRPTDGPTDKFTAAPSTPTLRGVLCFCHSTPDCLRNRPQLPTKQQKPKCTNPDTSRLQCRHGLMIGA